MSKSINNVQHDIFLNRMQNNRPIACGFVKVCKDVVAEFWNSLTEELNSAGLPIKKVNEWKKVWIDQKRYVRSKAAANLKNQRETGGGPNRTKSLSASEQCIYELVGMKESVEGLENSFSFGLPKDVSECEKNDLMMKNDEKISLLALDDEISSEAPICSKLLTPSPLATTIRGESSNKNAFSIKRRRTEPQVKLTTAELIEQELNTQEKLCSTIVEMFESLKNHNKEVEVMMKRVYRSLEKSNDLKSKNIKELERHNSVIEKLREKEVADKIEKNRKLIEIEEMKLKLLQ